MTRQYLREWGGAEGHSLTSGEHWDGLAGAQVSKRQKGEAFIIAVFDLWNIEQVNMHIHQELDYEIIY